MGRQQTRQQRRAQARRQAGKLQPKKTHIAIEIGPPFKVLPKYDFGTL